MIPSRSMRAHASTVESHSQTLDASRFADTRRQPAGGTRFVVFDYCISLGVVTYTRTSEVKVVWPGQHAALVGLPYTLISLAAGWWGIPLGPVHTIRTIWRNLRGGTDVTSTITGPLDGQLPGVSPQ